MPALSTAALADALHHPAIWRGGSVAAALPGIATGFATLDAVLPGGGWPRGTLTELLPARPGVGEISLLAPALARLSREDERWLLWIAPPHVPYAPALTAAGIDLARLIVVRPHSAAEALWAARQALASKSASAVLAWLDTPDMHSLRRLQLAAEQSQAFACLLRPPHAAGDFSPAALRLRLDTGNDRRLAVHVLKRRGPRLERPVSVELRRDRHALDRDPPSRPAAASFPARIAI